MKKRKEKNKMNINDRVEHAKLGYGTVVNVPSSDMVEVKWDKKPDFWYNTGVNPCIVPEKELTFYKDSVYETIHYKTAQRLKGNKYYFSYSF
jgi:hypothetical protein